MQKVNVDVHIWNELRSNDRFGFILAVWPFFEKSFRVPEVVPKNVL